MTKAVNIALDEIGFAVEVAVPNMLHDFTASNKFRRPEQKQLEEGKLSGGKWDSLFVTCGTATVTVECEVSVAKLCVAAVESAANQRPNPRQKFRQTKRFTQAIACARLHP